MGKIGQERGRPHRERHPLVMDDAGRRFRVPYVLQYGAGAESER